MTFTWKRTNTLGKFGIDSDSRVPASVSKFLWKIVRNFATEAVEIQPDINTWIFEWGELSNQHVLGFAIRQSGGFPFFEHPTKRNKPGNTGPSSGRLDIWVLDPQIRAFFLIEYKHTIRKIPSSWATASETEDFKIASEQIDSISRASIQNMKMGKDWPVFGISLLSVGLSRESPIALGSRQSDIKSNVIAEMDFVRSNLKPRPRWSACWLLPTSKRNAPKSDQQADNLTEEQPVGMLWFARIVVK